MSPSSPDPRNTAARPYRMMSCCSPIQALASAAPIDRASAIERLVDGADEIVLTQQLDQAGAVERDHGLGVHADENDFGSAAAKAPDDVLERVKSGGIDRIHIAHDEHESTGSPRHRGEGLLELLARAEEERPVDRVDLHAWRDLAPLLGIHRR